MFRNTYQSGFLSVLYSIGSKPLQIWDKKGASQAAGRGCAGWHGEGAPSVRAAGRGRADRARAAMQGE